MRYLIGDFLHNFKLSWLNHTHRLNGLVTENINLTIFAKPIGVRGNNSLSRKSNCQDLLDQTINVTNEIKLTGCSEDDANMKRMKAKSQCSLKGYYENVNYISLLDKV